MGLLPETLPSDVRGLNLPLLAALHDIGKVSPSFQWLVTENFDPAEKARLRQDLGIEDYAPLPDSVRPHHSTISCAALWKTFGKDVALLEGAHHGGNRTIDSDGQASRYGGQSWQKARMELAEALEGRFGSIGGSAGKAAMSYATGFVTVCDWLSSSLAGDADSITAPEQAAEKVRDAGFARHAVRKGLSFQDIFGFSPRTGQTILHSVVDHPGIYVYEAATGSGKTEAALYAAYRMLETGQATGLYFALPTALTARQAALRVGRFLDAILEEKADVIMAYGESFLDKVVFSDGFPEPSWFDWSKRQLLAPFAVGTVDQAMMAVMNVRHSAVRAFGLAGKVVILDEIHSYDVYTGNIIMELARRLEELGSTVIVLSATLREEARNSLLGSTSSAPAPSGYPMVTRVMDGVPVYTSWDAGARREVSIVGGQDRQAAMDDAVDDALDGMRVIWVENTVGEAQEVYRRLRARCEGLCGVGLLHSRMAHDDRAAMEKRCLEVFGKGSSFSGGYILVGTQILEQSLDLDADSMYSALCPADMLIQRMGRLWRHQRTGRRGKPALHVIGPAAQTGASSRMFGPSGAVYEPYVLYRTWERMKGLKSIAIPDDVRQIIEDVYREPCGDEPAEVVRMRADMLRRKERMDLLSSSALSSAGEPLPEDRVPTRYGDAEQIPVLLLRKLDIRAMSVVTKDGDEVGIRPDVPFSERARTSRALVQSSVKARADSVPEPLLAGQDVAEAFAPFIHMGNEAGFGIALWDGSSSLQDIYGNDVDGIGYSTEFGFYIMR